MYMMTGGGDRRPFVAGTSAPMVKVYELLRKLAPSDINVLITGESGTGKELIARALHGYSRRGERRFVAVNCAALPENLVESELFGHEKGAFTGAALQRIGKFELAHGGTLFLDEIGEMPRSAHGKTLRVLQERELERVGGNRTVKLDVRLIAATNKDLERSTHDGSFREDLLYRLKVAAIHLPPLRERRDDILPLAGHFLSVYAGRDGRSVSGFSDRAMEALMDYSFPGNVRELENIVHLAVILGRGERITLADLPEDVTRGCPENAAREKRRVKSGELLARLMSVTGSNGRSTGERRGGSIRPDGLKKIHEFLVAGDGREFSRGEFANFLSEAGQNGRNKYGTAGRFLRILRDYGILDHNGKKANQARCRLCEAYLSSE